VANKSRTSVSIDPDLKERLENDPSVNASGLFNQFLREYYERGQADGLEARIRDLTTEIEAKESELERLQEDLEQLREERDDLQERLEDRDEGADPQVQEAISTLASIGERKLTPDNPAVQTQAQKLGMKPGVLCEQVRDAKQAGEVPQS